MAMSGRQRPIRVLMAVYMALMLPLCCCYTSAWATACCTPRQADTRRSAEGLHDHGHRDHDHQHPEGSQDPGVPAPAHQHGDESCDCGCDGVADRLTSLEASDNLTSSALAVQCSHHQVLRIVRRQLLQIPRSAAIPLPCNSLLQQHCALIV